MALKPLPPPRKTLTPKPTPQIPPPVKPPDPTLTDLFPEKTPYRAPGNPFSNVLPKETEESYKQTLREVTSDLRSPFTHGSLEPLAFQGDRMGSDLSSESFNDAVVMVLMALESGYNPDKSPLKPTDWARLACSVTAAAGRGYQKTCASTSDNILEKIRTETHDDNPIDPKFPTLFHRLAAIGEHLEHCISTDLNSYQDWLGTLKRKTDQKLAKLATADLEEKWREWKADQIDRRAAADLANINLAVRERNLKYLVTTASTLGLECTPKGTGEEPRPAPVAGKKRTASGAVPLAAPSTPKATCADPSTPTPRRTNPPRAARRPSPFATPRGRPTSPTTKTPPRVEPSPTPRPKKAALEQVTALGITVDKAAPTAHQFPLRATTTPPAEQPLQELIAAAIRAAMNPLMARLVALERTSMPPPPSPSAPRRQPSQGPGPNTTRYAEEQMAPEQSNKASVPSSVTRPDDDAQITDQPFTVVKRRNRRKGGERQKQGTGQDGSQSNHIILTPQSYASITATAKTSAQPPKASPKPTASAPAITEVTVIRQGGHMDNLVERQIWVRNADAIVREVKLNMAKAVERPIPLRAGRWSVHPRSKGNFVYSFNGHISFDIIASYEHILLGPFGGSGQLRPSLGWTRVIAHGVPFVESDGRVFGPEALLTEVRTLPGLKRAVFAMEPRWLRPIGQIGGPYSSITFAYSDPDGTITSTLLKGRPALFGKEVQIQKWIDKPQLVQCSRCHALGHNKASKACPLGRDSVKCYICGGAHKSEEHDQKCPRKHAIAGVCDCTNYKCINCLKTGHNCREEICPAREQYRPRSRRPAGGSKSKGKQRDPAEGPGLAGRETHAADADSLMGPNLTAAPGNEPETAVEDNELLYMNVDDALAAGQITPPLTWAPLPYSPSHPQGSAATNLFD